MKKALGFGLLIMGCSFLLTGCWDKVEIDDRNYVITMGIDKYEEGQETQSMNQGEGDRITLSLGNAKLKKENKEGGGEKGAEDKEKQAELLSGKTLSSAMKLADTSGSRRIYFGHTKAVILGQSLLEDRTLLMETLDTLERNREINAKMIILAADKLAADAVEAIVTAGEDTGLYLWDFYKNNAKNTSSTRKLDFESLLIALKNGGDAMIPLIKTQDGKFTLGGAAVLRDGTLCGYLDDKQMEGVLFLLSDAGGAVLEGEAQGAILPLRVIRNRMQLSFTEWDSKILAHIKIHIEGNLEGYSLEGESLMAPGTIENLEGVFSETAKETIEKAMDTLQNEYQADCLELEQKLKKWNYPLYQKYRGEERDLFPEMELQVEVDTEISGTGVIS